jgi:(4S)-4-hydroxy-5-phosphonooxypentane-2,3-dione isomerase
MFVVTVTYEIKPEHCQDFRTAILKNSAASLSDEPGCDQFDVSFSDDGRRCFLYEVYTDGAAFEAHRGMPHFKEYDVAVRDWVLSKKVETYTRANDPKEEK